MLYKFVESEFVPKRDDQGNQQEEYDWAESALYEYVHGLS